jgi:hypothetical protein
VELPSSAVPKSGSDFPANPLLLVRGGRVVLGKPEGFPSFGWDNEYGSKEIQVWAAVEEVPFSVRAAGQSWIM